MLLKIILNANKVNELSKGLMFSNPLEKDECAFFTFPYTDDHSFWNKNVDYPISLLFLDENFEIKHIDRLEKQQETPIRSNYPFIKYVVEGHNDLPVENDINIGDFCFPEKNIIKIIKVDKNHKKK